MGKRQPPEPADDFPLMESYTVSMHDTILAKFSKTDAASKADACALLSALDPRAAAVQQAFLTPEFCGGQLFPCLVHGSAQVAMEAANTVKTWLHGASEEESLAVVRRLHGLGLLPVLAESVGQSLRLVETFVALADNDRKVAEELLESQLACMMLLAETLPAALEPINASPLIQLLAAIYEKRQFLSDTTLLVAAECLSAVTEDNEGFYGAGPHALRLYTLLLGLPADWSATKALPLSLRSLLALSGVHGNAKDAVHERCLAALGGVLAAPGLAADVVGCACETLANMCEEVDPECLGSDDKHLLMRVLEQTCKALTRLTGSADEHAPAAVSRALGALVNLLVLVGDFAGDNIGSMIWREALDVWLAPCAASEEAFGTLLTVLRLLQLNFAAKPCAACTPETLQRLVDTLRGYKLLYQPGILVVLPLLQQGAPAGLAQIVADLLPAVRHADPEFKEDLVQVLDAALGPSASPLPLRMEALLAQLQ